MNEIATSTRQEPAISAPALPVERVLQAVISAASDPAVDVAKMRELLGLQKELMAMQAEQQFNEAFARMSRLMPRIKKDGTVEYKNKNTGQLEKSFKFATWETIAAGEKSAARSGGDAGEQATTAEALERRQLLTRHGGLPPLRRRSAQ